MWWKLSLNHLTIGQSKHSIDIFVTKILHYSKNKTFFLLFNSLLQEMTILTLRMTLMSAKR